MRSAGRFACAATASGDAIVAARRHASVLRIFFIFTVFGLGGSRDAGMYEAHGHRPLADGRGASLHGATPNIACGEHSRKACLEKKRGAPGRAPPVGLDRVGWKGVAGENETLLVERHAAAQPARVRVRTDKKKERARIDLSLGSVETRVSKRSQVSVPLELRHLAAEIDGYVVNPLHLVDEIARHARAEIGAPHDNVHMLRAAREIHD